MADLHPLVQYMREPRSKPRIPREKCRTLRVPVLVSPAEKAQLRAMAKERGTKVATILRAAIDAVPPTRLEQQVLSELHVLTANVLLLLNQAIAGHPDPDEITKAVIEVQLYYQKIIRAL